MDAMELEATVERCREGDEAAWSALVGTTLRPIYPLCASYAPSAAEAEELTQEVYFKLWENLHHYRPGSNFMAWAWRVARNLLIDSYRKWPDRNGGSPVGNARKCHFCLHRLKVGMLPACVTSCIGRATIFGDRTDPQSLVYEMIGSPRVYVLKEDLGTRPSVYYLK